MERERYQHFFTYGNMAYNVGDSAYYLPADVSYLDSLTYQGIEVEECHSSRHFNLMKTSEDFAATVESPVYLRVYTSNSNSARNEEILVAPFSVMSALELFYVRRVIPCKWTYNDVSNAPLFNSSAADYSDIDLHESEKTNMVIDILSLLGIKLREPDLAQYAEVIKDKNIKEENAI
jgi:hypothetical protein